MQVLVRDNNVDQALKALKKKMQREGIFREMKLRGHYEKPSEKRARETGGGRRAAPANSPARRCSAKACCRRSRSPSSRAESPASPRRRAECEISAAGSTGRVCLY